MILGFLLDDDIYIGNADFIISQIELLIDKAQTDDEFYILYYIYAMAQQFDKMGQIIREALDADLGPIKQLKWKNQETWYEVKMQVEAAIKAFKEAKASKGFTLTKE